MPELDRAWSIQLRKAIGAPYKQCYKNAFVEGYVAELEWLLQTDPRVERFARV
jgi:hypothetical protein